MTKKIFSSVDQPDFELPEFTYIFLASAELKV